jgi:hypothetical protein
MLKMPRCSRMASASGVVGPLAPSARILTRLEILEAFSPVIGVLEGGGDEDVDVLGDPRVAGQDLVAQVGGLSLVDAAEAVGDLAELGEVDAVGAQEGVGLLVFLVPAGDAGDGAAELL